MTGEDELRREVDAAGARNRAKLRVRADQARSQAWAAFRNLELEPVLEAFSRCKDQDELFQKIRALDGAELDRAGLILFMCVRIAFIELRQRRIETGE